MRVAAGAQVEGNSPHLTPAMREAKGKGLVVDLHESTGMRLRGSLRSPLRGYTIMQA